MFLLLLCDQKLMKISLVLHTRQLSNITEKLKQNAERYGVREGSPVEVQLSMKVLR